MADTTISHFSNGSSLRKSANTKIGPCSFSRVKEAYSLLKHFAHTVSCAKKYCGKNVNGLHSSFYGLDMRPPKIADLKKEILRCLEEGRYLETVHVQLREMQRGITFQDIVRVLKTGRHEKSKDTFDQAFQAWNYAMRGFTLEQKELRVIVSFDEEEGLLIITAFYL